VIQQGGIDVVGAVKRFGDIEVLKQVSIDVAPGEIVALLGPSGCGKTTLLRSIAGLERLDGGAIAIGGVEVSAPSVHVRPEQRRIGMVFQDWALFPHLTVAQNIGYGLTREERRGDRIAESLALVGLDGLGDRLPATLSGGQQQRVALARALAPQPTALLLDEPFSNLDTSLRVQVRAEVHRLLAELGVTTVFVTHDQEEAFVLGDRVAVMHEGRIEQLEQPAQIYANPASRWVAHFVGEANLIRAEATGDRAQSAIGPLELQSVHVGPVDVLVRPEQLVLADLDGTGSPDSNGSSGEATVQLVEYYGHDHVSVVELDDGTSLRSRGPGAPSYRRGQRVKVNSAAVSAPAFPLG
jgi:iron(III) transport system ATP-binding protein